MRPCATVSGEGMNNSTYRRLMQVLVDSSVDYRVIHHRAEGRTERASVLRGHPLASAAKCMVVHVRHERENRHVVAVLPGDRRVDYRKLRREFGAVDVRMADRSVAEELTGCQSGCIIPFSFADELSVVFDPSLLLPREVYFNAARLDRSIGLRPDDLVSLVRPRIADISKAEK
ncbi:hypothetical protein HMPREF1486_03500 [Streptomyces sp. HPH0547]|nr:hypothetical protein HMPREF1486_03500 [Streptomyces sp. HPH0547]